MAKYNQFILHELYKKHNAAKESGDKKIIGAVLQEAMETLGLQKSAVYDQFRKIETGATKQKANKVKPEYVEDLVKIAKVKQAHSTRKGKPLSTAQTVRALQREGKISLDISVSQVDRLIVNLGLSNKHFDKTQVTSTRLRAQYANQFVICDASPFPQYYFNIKDKTYIRNMDLRIDVSHQQEFLTKYNLVKLWCYFMRDLYSGAYLVLIANPTTNISNGGENSLDWLKTLKYYCFIKQDTRIPIHGIPEHVLFDATSSVKSNIWKDVASSLKMVTRVHVAGRPEAKGFIEGQIGAFQRFALRAMDRDKFHSLEDIQNYVHKWVVYDNQIKGYFNKYYKSIQQNPPKLVMDQNILNVYKYEERVLTNYRTVEINKEHYLLIGAAKNDLQEGEKIRIYKRFDGSMYAVDDSAREYRLELGKIERDAITHHTSNGEELVLSQRQLLRKEVAKDAKKFVRQMSQDSFLPPEIPYPEYDLKLDRAIHKPAELPHEEIKLQTYLTQILQLTELKESQISPETWQEVNKSLMEVIQSGNELTESEIEQLADSIVKEIKENNQ